MTVGCDGSGNDGHDGIRRSGMSILRWRSTGNDPRLAGVNDICQRTHTLHCKYQYNEEQKNTAHPENQKPETFQHQISIGHLPPPCFQM